MFQAHDFFKPQPVYPPELDLEASEAMYGVYGPREEPKPVVPSVFLLRVVTHDWPDSYVTRYAKNK